MGKHDEGYYEDEGEFLDEYEAPTRLALRQRIVAVFSTSYGISIALHVGLLLILATIVITSPPKAKDATIQVIPPPVVQKYDPEAERAMEKNELVPIEEKVDIPIVDTFEEPVPVERPKGEEQNKSNVNLNDTSFVTAYGVGGGKPAGAYGHRDGEGRANKFGGGPKTEKATDAGLLWLRNHQSSDGRWDADGWRKNCSRGPTCSGPGVEDGAASYDVGVTSLALLAFMGDGSSSRFGRFKRVVRKGLRWLKSQQRADGSVGFEPGQHSTVYNHALATMALCEGYGISRDWQFRAAAQKAIDVCVQAQNPGLGWRYGIRDGRNDTSVTGWMVLALKAGHTAGLSVPKKAFEGARAWFGRATASSGEVGYMSPGGGSAVLPQNDGIYDSVPTLTAVSTVCRIFAGERKSQDTLRKGMRQLDAELPAWSPRKTNFYYWYYGTYAMFHAEGNKWDRWNQAMKDALLPNQRKGACEDGSWDPIGEWCRAGGRVYATAINVLTLEIYYRYKRANHVSLPAPKKKSRKG